MSTGSTETKVPTVDEVQQWLIAYLSKLLDLEKEEVSTTTSFSRYGLDSSEGIVLCQDLGNWIGKSIDPTIIYSYSTIEAMAQYFGE